MGGEEVGRKGKEKGRREGGRKEGKRGEVGWYCFYIRWKGR